MSTWYSKELKISASAIPNIITIDKAFKHVFFNSPNAGELAIFYKFNQNTHSFTVFFSPKTKKLALAFGAKACIKPDQYHAGKLLCGDKVSSHNFFTVSN